MTDATPPTGPLHGVTVLDLTRILAGPTCTQLLGDLGATVIKVENPGTGGDDTRQWGPPFVAGPDGQDTDLSAYFMCANRNKRSVAIDLSPDDGQAQVRALARTADIMIENFKPDGLKRFGLDAQTMSDAHSSLIYCSISGYGQTGPNRAKPGYDIMAQGFGGIMSVTGAPDGPPMKVGVGIADVMCGMYATIGILSALHERTRSGKGQIVDISLVDSQIAWTINEGVNTLLTGKAPERRGNAHPNIMPYDVFPTADGHVILAVGNDSQFRRFADWLGHPEWAEDARFATNPARLENRRALTAKIEADLSDRTTDQVIAGLEAIKVPAGPVQDMLQMLNSDQAKARNMVIEMASDDAGAPLRLLGNPLNLSRTPVTYRRPPPRFGADTDEVLNGFGERG